MEYRLNVADIRILFRGQREFMPGERMAYFFTPEENGTDVTVSVSDYTGQNSLPRTYLGRDMLTEYYRVGDGFCCEAPGRFGPVISTCYNANADRLDAFINEPAYPGTFRTLDKLFQLLPMRHVLLNHDALLIHSSCVECEGKAVLFTGPSGIGKTTQANLWMRHTGAQVMCSDRTVLRFVDGLWHAYGYPVDGSSPVSRPGRCRISAIISLRQAEENQLCRLSAASALLSLAGQTVMDTWNSAFRTRAVLLLSDLLERIPVYQLDCLPEDSAVDFLMIRLKKDGVL